MVPGMGLLTPPKEDGRNDGQETLSYCSPIFPWLQVILGVARDYEKWKLKPGIDDAAPR